MAAQMIIDLIDTQWYTITIRREYKKDPLEAEKNRIITYLGKCQTTRRISSVAGGDGTDTE